MTTVCVDIEGNIAADSRVTEGSLIVSENFKKIRKFKSKEFGQVYIGIAGALSHAVELFNYIEQVFDGVEDETKEPLKFISDYLQVLLLDEEGNVHSAEFTDKSIGVNWIPLDKPASIGSGSHVCLGALEAGLNAYDSVMLTSKRDCFSNSNVKSFSYKDLSYDHIVDERILELEEELVQLKKTRDQSDDTPLSEDETKELISDIIKEIEETPSEETIDNNEWIPWEAKADSVMPSWLTGDETLDCTFEGIDGFFTEVASEWTWNTEGGTIIQSYRIHTGGSE